MSEEEDFAWDDDDFDPEAGFQKEEKKNEWEGEDEGLDVAAIVEPAPVPKTATATEPKKTMEERIAEKKAKRREAEVAEEVKEKIVSAEEEKLRQRKLQEEADLVVAMETFGLASGGVLDSMDPKSNEEFDKFREALCDKITKYKSSQYYTKFVEQLLIGTCKELDVDDLRLLSTTLSTLATEKQKAKAPKKKKKGKMSLGAKAVGKGSGQMVDNLEDGLGAEYDDFM